MLLIFFSCHRADFSISPLKFVIHKTKFENGPKKNVQKDGLSRYVLGLSYCSVLTLQSSLLASKFIILEETSRNASRLKEHIYSGEQEITLNKYVKLDGNTLNQTAGQ